MNKLKTPMQALAAVIAVAAYAEHNYNEPEKAAVKNIAEELELPELPQLVEQEVQRVWILEDEPLADYLLANVRNIVPSEEAYLMEAAMQIVMADGQFAYTEASNLLVIADAMHFEHSLVVLMVADALRENTNIKVTISK